MRVLLDTNIIIHRENNIISNYSIGNLFNWIDKLKYTKIIHPYTIDEINNHEDKEIKKVFAVKLESYEVLKTVKKPSTEFLSKIKKYSISANDEIDNYLLNEVYLKRVDILITEDRKMLKKAVDLKISKRVFSIDQFISIVTTKYPKLMEYKMLAVNKEYFGDVELMSPFFDSFRRDYKEFDKWFAKKCDKTAYVCKDEKRLLGFLYLKVEDEKENYSDITPIFGNAKRLKIGTFKVESTGFRLGERLIKIIFDNALLYDVDEIYVTLFIERQELIALAELLTRWGFIRHGIKSTSNGEETVLVKKLKSYASSMSPKRNYPNLTYNRKKFILPIYDKYHTTLLPDSKLNNENENNFVDLIAHRYALQKVYISWAPERDIDSGDFIIFYRMEASGRNNKKYKSVITTVGIVDEIVYNFNKKEEYLKHCQNRSVFTNEELNIFWDKHRYSLMVIKFIYVKSLTKRLTLAYLWDKGIIKAPGGPRPFTKLTDNQFDNILRDSLTCIRFSETN